MDAQIKEIYKQLEIDYESIKDNPIELSKYKNKKNMLMECVRKYERKMENDKHSFKECENNEFIKCNTMIPQREKIEKINNLRNNAYQSNTISTPSTNNRTDNITAEYVTINITPPNKWLLHYELSKNSYNYLNNQSEYQIKISSIPKEHFVVDKNRSKHIFFDLYVEYKVPKILTILFTDGDGNVCGDVVCGKTLEKNEKKTI